MIGNSFQVLVIAGLLLSLLHQIKVRTPSFKQLCDQVSGKLPFTGLAQEASRALPKSSSGPLKQQEDEALSLVKSISRGCTFKGADVRLLAPEGSAALWPRKPIPSGWWNWKTIIAYKFRHLLGQEHINILELRAFLSMIKWRSSCRSLMGKRFIHLLDSQVCLGIIAKGRTSSRKMKTVLQQSNALCLAAHLLPLCAYVATQDNPADAPSRSSIRRSRHKRFRRWGRKLKF
jgi:hypothetical protein